MIFKKGNIYNNSQASILRSCLCAVIFLAVTSGNNGLAQTVTYEITKPTTTVGSLVSEDSPAPFLAAALRTNLLADLVGGVNAGVELPAGNRFSVAADLAFAHTRIGNFTLQAIQGNIEGRYWFKQGRNKLTGWNVGVYATYNTRFDIQLGGGYQGDGYFSAGLSGGYSLPLSNRLNLDLSVAAGYLYSPEIRKYGKPENGHLIWEETRYNVGRFALTQVRVNLVWLINKHSRNR